MKKEIRRFNDGTINYICNYNDRGQLHGLNKYYFSNGNLMWKANYFNDNLYGLITDCNGNSEINKLYYYL